MRKTALTFEKTMSAFLAVGITSLIFAGLSYRSLHWPMKTYMTPSTTMNAELIRIISIDKPRSISPKTTALLHDTPYLAPAFENIDLPTTTQPQGPTPSRHQQHMNRQSYLQKPRGFT